MPNIGYIRGKKESIIVDAGCGPKTTKKFFDQLKELNLEEPKKAIITHFHWDHTFALSYMFIKSYGTQYAYEKLLELKNKYHNQTTDIISDDLMPLFCYKDILKEFGKSVIKIPQIDEIVQNKLTIDLGDKIVEIIPVASSHTEGSLIVYVPDDKVLFIGDADLGIIKEGKSFYDPIKAEEFLKVVKEIDFNYIVPGHTGIMTKKEYFN